MINIRSFFIITTLFAFLVWGYSSDVHYWRWQKWNNANCEITGAIGGIWYYHHPLGEWGLNITVIRTSTWVAGIGGSSRK